MAEKSAATSARPGSPASVSEPRDYSLLTIDYELCALHPPAQRGRMKGAQRADEGARGYMGRSPLGASQVSCSWLSSSGTRLVVVRLASVSSTGAPGAGS